MWLNALRRYHFKQRDTRFDPGLKHGLETTKPTDGANCIKMKWSKHDESCLKKIFTRKNEKVLANNANSLVGVHRTLRGKNSP